MSSKVNARKLPTPPSTLPPSPPPRPTTRGPLLLSPPGLENSQEPRVKLSPATRRRLPDPTKASQERWNGTPNNIWFKRNPSNTPPHEKRHTRQRARSFRSLHKHVQVQKVFNPFVEEDEEELDEQPIYYSSHAKKLVNLTGRDYLSAAPITINIPTTPILAARVAPSPPNSPPKEKPTARHILPLSPPISPPSKPQREPARPVLAPHEVRARLIATALLRKSQGGRTRRSHRKEGYTPSGLSQVVSASDSEDYSSDSEYSDDSE